MTEAEQERVVRKWGAGEIALALFLAMSLTSIGWRLRAIERAILFDTKIMLCLEVWKAGNESEICDRLRK